MARPKMRSLWIAVVALAVTAMVACGRTTTVQASFTVEGMTCESCSSAITDALTKVEGVERATADHLSGTAEAVFTSPAVSPEQLAAEIEGLGYTVTSISVAAPDAS